MNATSDRMVCSDVFGAPKPEGDVPESLIPKPDRPRKSEPEPTRHQPILNFTLKPPETPKTRGGRP